jgi:hypothetical protein
LPVGEFIDVRTGLALYNPRLRADSTAEIVEPRTIGSAKNLTRLRRASFGINLTGTSELKLPDFKDDRISKD